MLCNIQAVEVFVTRICRPAPTDLLPEAAPSHLKRLCWGVVQVLVELLRLILLVVQMSVELLRLILLSDNNSRTFTCGPPLVSARISNIIYRQ